MSTQAFGGVGNVIKFSMFVFVMVLYTEPWSDDGVLEPFR